MNWKKILKYLSVFLFLGLILFAYLAQQNTLKIYGAKTELVDHFQFKPLEKALCIKNVNLLSEDGQRFIPNQTLCIENGKIVSIDSTHQASTQRDFIDGTGKYLIPGLIDSHVHLFKSQNDLLLYVATGVTEIREMIGDEDHLSWRKEIQAGRIGPEMFIASPRLGSFGTLEGWFMKWTQGFNNISTAEEAETYVTNYAKQGYNAVKIYSHLNEEAYEAVNEIAIREGLKVVGHIPFDLDLSAIWASNQSEIAHIEEIMNAIRREFGSIEGAEGAAAFEAYAAKRSKEIAKNLIEEDIAVTTTVWLTQSFVRQKFELEQVLKEVELEYENPGISEWDENIPGGLGWLPHINRYKLAEGLNKDEKEGQRLFWYTYGHACHIILENLAAAGVKILAGTDANLPPTVPGFSLHDELIAMHAAGMSNAEVLRSATALPAQWMESNTGIIAEGYKANLLLLDGNPLENLKNTRSINHVFLNGKIYDRDLLDNILESVKEANDRSRTQDIREFLEN